MHQFRRLENKRWDEAADNQLRELVAAGHLLPAIALEIGRTQEASRSRANVLRISVKSTERPRRVGVHSEP